MDIEKSKEILLGLLVIISLVFVCLLPSIILTYFDSKDSYNKGYLQGRADALKKDTLVMYMEKK